MIARPQLDLLGVAPSQAATAVKATSGGAQARFDVALLQATKSMRDSAPEGQSLAIDPKVQAAFEATLQQLAQSPADQLNSLAQDKKGLQGLVDHAAQAAGLGAEGKTVLGVLTAAALPRLVQAKLGMLSTGVNASNDRGGEQPGPQGGSPALAQSPAGNIQAVAKPRTQEVNTPTLTLSALAAQALTPVIISVRTDDGSQAAGLVSLAPANGPVQGAPTGQPGPAGVGQAVQGTQPQGRAILISTQGGSEAQAPVALVPQIEAAMQQGLALQQGTEAQAPASAAGPEPAPAVANPLDAPAASSSAKGAPGPGVPEEMQARFLPITEAVAVQAGSVVTLKGDGTLEAPKAPTMQVPVAAVPGAPSQASSASPVLSAGPPAQALVSSAGVTGVIAPLASAVVGPTPQGGVVAIPLPVPGQVASDPAPLAPALPQGLTTHATEAQALPSVPVGPTLPPTGSLTLTLSLPPAVTAGAVAVGVASRQAQTPGFTPVSLGNPAPVENSPSVVVGGGTSAPAMAAGDASAPVAAQSGTKSQDATGPLAGLGQPGPESVKALAQSVGQTVALKQATFQQVTQALLNAPGAESGRLVISLKPASLGDVTVDLVLTNGKVSAQLIASSAAVRDAFVQDLAGFKAGLESHGITVHEVSVALRADVQQGQSQGQPQPQPQFDQGWWRSMAQAPSSELALFQPSVPYFGADLGVDQRFSALA